MRNNYWNLAWGILGAFVAISKLIDGSPIASVFGLEINYILYSFIWIVVSVVSFKNYFKRRKEEANQK